MTSLFNSSNIGPDIGPDIGPSEFPLNSNMCSDLGLDMGLTAKKVNVTPVASTSHCGSLFIGFLNCGINFREVPAEFCAVEVAVTLT